LKREVSPSHFPQIGNICRGARTLLGSDQQGSEWKYIPVQRLALYLEASLYQGSKWAVFEPNVDLLWAQIRMSFGAFMPKLFRDGAFQGTNPGDAFFIRGDALPPTIHPPRRIATRHARLCRLPCGKAMPFR